MQYTDFSRKQANVLYAAHKSGKIRLSKEAIKRIYGLADSMYINDDYRDAEFRDKCKAAVDAYFNGNEMELNFIASWIIDYTAPLVYDDEKDRYVAGKPTFEEVQ